MGEKGARHTPAAAETAERLVEELAPLGTVTSKKMFGGHGVFEGGVMFALVDSGGAAFLRCDDATAESFEQLGSRRHGKMPYWNVPDEVMADPGRLREWASGALEVARAAKA